MTAQAPRPTDVAYEASGGDGAPAFAGLATRTLAFAGDAAVINAVIWFVALVVAVGLSVLKVPDSINGVLVVIGAVIASVWTVAYFVFFWSASGQTPGNRVMGLRVVQRRTGRPLSARRALLRVLLLPLSALPLCAGFLLILVEPRRRALHDLLAGTVGIYEGARRARRRP
jgi:uncharacterized RDD family membrane protein YckC